MASVNFALTRASAGSITAVTCPNRGAPSVLQWKTAAFSNGAWRVTGG